MARLIIGDIEIECEINENLVRLETPCQEVESIPGVKGHSTTVSGIFALTPEGASLIRRIVREWEDYAASRN